MSLELHGAAEGNVAHEKMKARIDQILGDKEKRGLVKADFLYTFRQLGMREDDADQLCQNIFRMLQSPKLLPVIEAQCLEFLKTIEIRIDSRNVKKMLKVLQEKFTGRAETIYAQVAPCFKGVHGRILDYGAGDGQVTQMLHDQSGLLVDGVDIRSYPAKGVTVPMKQFDGGHVPVADGFYGAALLTNVFHHEADNEKILQELKRVVHGRIVVIETVPIGDTEEAMQKDMDRTFMNDYLYNRIFHSADVPVPGTFETPEGWRKRFAKYGWKPTTEKDLGIDQPTIRDRHYLFIIE